jgi:hypothetical protein
MARWNMRLCCTVIQPIPDIISPSLGDRPPGRRARDGSCVAGRYFPMRRNPLSFLHPFLLASPASYRRGRGCPWRRGTSMRLPPRSRSPSPRPRPVSPARSATSRPRGSTAGIPAPAPISPGVLTPCACSCGYASFSVTNPRVRVRLSRNVCPLWRLPGRAGPYGLPSSSSPTAEPSAERPVHGSWPGWGCGPGRTPGCGWCRRLRRLTPATRRALGWRSGPGGAGNAMGRSWSTRRSTGSWSCCPSARRRAWPPGSCRSRPSSASVAIGVRSPPRACAVGHRRPCRGSIGFS